jgi:uncharacterized DUF497 family protein
VLIDFDSANDSLNRARHGLSLVFAKQLIWHEAFVWIDKRYDYDETRMIGLVSKGNKLYTLHLWTGAKYAESSVCDMPRAKRSNTMPKVTARRVIRMPSPAENAKILAAAKADPDAQPLTKKQLAAMAPLRSVRGRPKVREYKAACVRALQPGGHRVFPRHRRRMADANGWRVERVCQ